jgi:apolipoprotein N-acyltransferase
MPTMPSKPPTPPPQQQPPSAVERSPFRRVGAAAPVEEALTFAQTRVGRVVLVLLSVALLSLAYAPVKQFYLAWVGLVPWLVLVAHAKSKRAAFFWSWGMGALFSTANVWWIVYTTAPGAVGLMFYMGFWVGLTALVLRGAGVFDGLDGTTGAGAQVGAAWRPLVSIVAIAAAWVAQEWIRGWLFTGFPWLFLGHTQTPVLAMCQVADFASAYGVTFWVVLINGWVAFLFLHRLSVARLVLPGVAVVAVLAGTLGYGVYRMGQETTRPGPRVMVVQPNFPQDNSGQKGATYDELAEFHFKTTQAALDALVAQRQPLPDLVIWSETMLPELNAAYRRYAHGFVRKDDRRNVGEWLDSIHVRLGELSQAYGVNLLVGGHARVPDRMIEGEQRFSVRNSAYFYDRMGEQSPLRYDKIHLVPFGEYIPFRESFPPLFKFFNLFNPYDGDHTIAPGTELTIFPLPPRLPGGGAATAATTTGPSGASTGPWVGPAGYRFAPAICFEDVDSVLMARMFAGEGRSKRADFIANLTNDGWFGGGQMAQHLQLAAFRSIENRVPTARSVNTGISGFIDSVGRTHDTISVRTIGTGVATLNLDRRVAPYTHVGDVFAGLCLVATGGMAAAGVWNGMKKRRGGGR